MVHSHTRCEGMGWAALVTQCVNTSIPSHLISACVWMHHKRRQNTSITANISTECLTISTSNTLCCTPGATSAIYDCLSETAVLKEERCWLFKKIYRVVLHSTVVRLRVIPRFPPSAGLWWAWCSWRLERRRRTRCRCIVDRRRHWWAPSSARNPSSLFFVVFGQLNTAPAWQTHPYCCNARSYNSSSFT